MNHYGHLEHEGEGYPLAAWVWGHRLRVGQHWIEYLLEFLNVLSGFDYRLGQGLDGYGTEGDYLATYHLATRLGLRRFVFYDERERARHPLDDSARAQLMEALREGVLRNPRADEEALVLARSLLRAFSAVEEQRSWYAKSLFPAHHNLLFWEALRKGATKYEVRQLPEGVPPRTLDSGLSFTDRNFFARGGEVYYLVLSAGTESNPENRSLIARRLQTLLNDHNQALGVLAGVIDQVWSTLLGSNENEPHGTLGWIPDPACPLYARIADDVATFLQHNLDPLESLDLLAHLMGLHLVQYIYHRAHPQATMERHADSTCTDLCRPILLIDALGGQDGNVIRNLSVALFREQEHCQVQKGAAFVGAQVNEWATEFNDDPNLVDNLISRAEAFFDVGRLHKRTREPYQRQIGHLLNRRVGNGWQAADFANEYSAALTGLLMGDFRKNFLGVHRKLAKSIGLVSPRQGASGRFVLGDNLLKALVLANLLPGSQLTFGDFLARLYDRYGFVVGPGEGRASGLFDRQRVNAEYYDRNRSALLEKMKHAGLLVEYSDATALVQAGSSV